MFDLNMIYDAKFERVSNSVVAGTTDVQTSIVDMQGYTSIAFLVLLGTVTAGGQVTLTAKSNSANALTGADLLAATTTIVNTDNSNKALLVDVNKPTQQYVFLDMARATANVVIDGVIAILYNAIEHPVTQDTSVAASAFVVDEI